MKLHEHVCSPLAYAVVYFAIYRHQIVCVCMRARKLSFDQTFLHKRKFSDRWISGADSICTRKIHEHASSNQHLMQ